MLASVTRLRIRSLRYLVPFLIRTAQSRKQAVATPGCIAVTVRKTQGLTFWTLSLWDSEASLRSFLSNSPHRAAMPKLFHWCDEAATCHWSVESRQLPGWEEAAEKLLQQGRLSRVKNPSNAQSEGRLNAT